jgi:UDP-N-acetylglucosamine--N-acetylmuramyl-(pentapeptide) pyrophosphoryl-undecaprenol N-acetylglucosamine transferase
MANAGALAEAGAATVIRQSDFSAEVLTKILIQKLADPALLAREAQAAAGIGRPRAAADLADMLENLMSKREAVR